MLLAVTFLNLKEFDPFHRVYHHQELLKTLLWSGGHGMFFFLTASIGQELHYLPPDESQHFGFWPVRVKPPAGPLEPGRHHQLHV